MVYITTVVFEHNFGSFGQLLNIDINEKSLRRVGRFRMMGLRPFSTLRYDQEMCQAMGKTILNSFLPRLEDPESMLLDAGTAIALSESPARGSSSSDSIVIRDRFLAKTVHNESRYVNNWM